MPVGRMDIVESKAHEQKDSDDLQGNHHVVCFRRFPNPANEDASQEHDDNECRPVEPEMPAGRVEGFTLQILESAWQVGRRKPSQVRMNTKPIKQGDDVS